MTLYTIALYAHILGAMGVAVALALEWTVLLRLRGAETAEQARAWLGLTAVVRRVGPASLVVLLVAGLYMAATTWGGARWIGVAFLALLLIAVLGAYNGIRLARVEQALGGQAGRLGPDLAARLRDPRFLASIQARVAIVAGVVLLMTAKPDGTASLLILGVALFLGLISALPAWGQGRAGGLAQAR